MGVRLSDQRVEDDDRLVQVPNEDALRRLNVLDRRRIVECRSRGTRVLLSSSTCLSFGCRRRLGVRRMIASVWWDGQGRLRRVAEAGRRARLRLGRAFGQCRDMKVLAAARPGRAHVRRIVGVVIAVVLIVVIASIVLLRRSELSEIIVAIGVKLCWVVVRRIARRQVSVGRRNLRRRRNLCGIRRPVRRIKWRRVLLHAVGDKKQLDYSISMVKKLWFVAKMSTLKMSTPKISKR